MSMRLAELLRGMEHCKGESWLVGFQFGDEGYRKGISRLIMKGQNKAVPGRRSGGVVRLHGKAIWETLQNV
jgi:hypothetical protein